MSLCPCSISLEQDKAADCMGSAPCHLVPAPPALPSLTGDDHMQVFFV